MWEEELRRRFCTTAFIPLEPGTHIRNGSLKVIRHLALGGLSALYLCQLQDKQLVVIKEAVIPEDATESTRDKAREMFDREATLLMKLNHPNIVKVLDNFVDNGRNYMMLEYVNGQDLRQFVKQNGPQKEHVVLEWAITVANILKHLHEQDPPILHRDLTPDNLVLRSDGQIVLIDFGAANEFIGNATGTFVGKQSFIAPEQFRGKACTGSDIYAFGCTLYFMLTGKEPEALSTSAPKEVVESISDDLNEFVVSCTEMEPRDRFASAAQMIPILKKMAASTLVS
jgi:serine/threonine-protein kinase